MYEAAINIPLDYPQEIKVHQITDYMKIILAKCFCIDHQKSGIAKDYDSQKKKYFLRHFKEIYNYK